MVKQLQEIFEYRELILNLAVRDLKVRYKGSFLGFFWSFLNPLLMMAVLFIIFSKIFRIQIENFPIFLLAGILPWQFFATVFSDTTKTITENANLIKKVYFPKEALILSIILSNLVNFLLSLFVLFIFILFCKIKLTLLIFLLPFILIIQLIFLIGMGLIFSALNVFFRDTIWIVNILLLAWFYLTPIFYPVKMIPKEYLSFYMLNPMAAIVSAYRNILLYGNMFNVTYLAATFFISLVLLFIGLKTYQKVSDIFPEEI